MSWRRGNKSVTIELANVQSKLEDWSEDLDGDEGVIAVVKELRTTIKIALWLGGCLVGLPTLFLGIVEVVRMAKGN